MMQSGINHWEKWEKTRAKGRARYIISRGLYLLLCITLLLGGMIVGGRYVNSVIPDTKNPKLAHKEVQTSNTEKVLLCIVYMTAVFGFAAGTWNIKETVYQLAKGPGSEPAAKSVTREELREKFNTARKNEKRQSSRESWIFLPLYLFLFAACLWASSAFLGSIYYGLEAFIPCVLFLFTSLISYETSSHSPHRCPGLYRLRISRLCRGRTHAERQPRRQTNLPAGQPMEPRHLARCR